MALEKRVLDNPALQRRMHHHLSSIHVPMKTALGVKKKKRRIEDPVVQAALDLAGEKAEDFVEVLCDYLVATGRMVWFHRTQHYDKLDRRGVDFLGSLRASDVPEFFVDVKSSRRNLTRRHLRGEARRRVLIFVPRLTAPHAEESERLLEEIQQFFNGIDKQADMV